MMMEVDMTEGVILLEISKEDIVDSKNSEIITELKEILSFLRGLNND